MVGCSSSLGVFLDIIEDLTATTDKRAKERGEERGGEGHAAKPQSRQEHHGESVEEGDNGPSVYFGSGDFFSRWERYLGLGSQSASAHYNAHAFAPCAYRKYSTY